MEGKNCACFLKSRGIATDENPQCVYPIFLDRLKGVIPPIVTQEKSVLCRLSHTGTRDARAMKCIAYIHRIDRLKELHPPRRTLG